VLVNAAQAISNRQPRHGDVTKYEYRVHDVEGWMASNQSLSKTQEELNVLGERGWEVVAPLTRGDGGTIAFVLKREK